MNKSLSSHHRGGRTRRFQRASMHLLTCFAVMAFLVGCSSRKSADKNSSTSGIIVTDVAQMKPSERYVALCDAYADWQDVTVPVRVNLTSPKKTSVSARAVMKHNEWIAMSVRMLGFEVASIWIDNDSIHAVDRYHKLYLSEGVNRLLAGTDITIGNLQDLLMGRACLLGKSGGVLSLPFQKLVKLNNSADGLMILPATQPQKFEYGYILSPTANNLLAASVSTIGGANSAVMTYSGFVDTPQGSFARNANINIVRDKSVSAELQWNLSSAKWNTGENRQWEQPGNSYQRISAEKLLKALTSL